MPPRLSLDDLAALVRRAGLPMTPEQIAALHQGSWGYLETMLDRVSGAGVDRFAEPAATFDPEQR
ncbi:hypothetical protein SAMN02983003_3704 [Devosia enhydra]|uniref:Uncharacterized protein n=1 Tax=Devosia enhydra TaxID=665118 RepID=A0A1K2I2A5_9HYPH|nr:hypothetical protein [Devosia enhydra]SFZ86522.1 hypothetical protein SAMN02983003_3704 [Devosia enhydra]